MPTDDDTTELPDQRRAYELPFEPHPCFGEGDVPLPGGRERLYVHENMDCLRASTAVALGVPFESVPSGLARGGSGIATADGLFTMLVEWTEWAEAEGLVPCVHTAAHPVPTDREWWIAMVLRIQGHAVHFNSYAMHHGQVVHSPLAAWSGFRLREHLAEFASPEEFLFPIVTKALRRQREEKAA